MEIEKQLVSHLYQNKENGKRIIQTNNEHQRDVVGMATSFSELFELPSWGHTLRMFHGKGEERDAFQQYIRMTSGLPVTDEKSYGEHHHAFVGGILVTNLMGKSMFNLLANQIISHHTGLHDYVDAENVVGKRQLPEEINKGDIALNTPQLRKELLESPFSKPKVDMKHFHHLSRMPFSCLVDADRPNTEQFMDVESWERRGCSSILADLLPKLEAHLRELQLYAPDTEVDHIRKEIQERCHKASPEEKGFHSLTVPTGNGKALSSLLWAMKHAVNHGMNHIIIAIPYTSIIVQTAGLLKEIFGEEHVLEHHSNFNPDEIKNGEVREKAKLATENWDYLIIVTINIQLFESMFSNKPSDCRELHSIVNSVLILDEAQTLPTGFLQPIVDAFKTYQKIFGVSVLFTTANQSAPGGLIEGTNPKANFEGIDRIIEIVPNESALYDRLHHVKLVIDDTGKTYDEIAAEVAIYNKVLCIVNTRKDAKELCDRLPNEGIKPHLSRMMCSAHISETIRKVKALLKDKSHPIARVIATQLVEVGVDVDFPVVLRQESGPDSILQAAGRCNREGRNTIGITLVFNLTVGKRIPFGAAKAANNARLNLPVSSNWFDPSTMTEYFCQLHCRKNTFDDKDIKHCLHNPIRK